MPPSVVLGVYDRCALDVIRRFSDRVGGIVHISDPKIITLLSWPILWSLGGQPNVLSKVSQRIHCFILDGPDPSKALEDVLATVREAFDNKKIRIWGLSNFSAEQCNRITEICLRDGLVHPSVFIGSAPSDIIRWARRYGVNIWAQYEYPTTCENEDSIIVPIDKSDQAIDEWLNEFS